MWCSEHLQVDTDSVLLSEMSRTSCSCSKTPPETLEPIAWVPALCTSGVRMSFALQAAVSRSTEELVTQVHGMNISWCFVHVYHHIQTLKTQNSLTPLSLFFPKPFPGLILRGFSKVRWLLWAHLDILRVAGIRKTSQRMLLKRRGSFWKMPGSRAEDRSFCRCFSSSTKTIMYRWWGDVLQMQLSDTANQACSWLS